MHFEKLRQRLPRCIRQVRPRSALDLRQVALAQLRSRLRCDRPRQFLLAHGAIHAPEAALHLAQVPDFFAQFHSSVRNQQSNSPASESQIAITVSQSVIGVKRIRKKPIARQREGFDESFYPKQSKGDPYHDALWIDQTYEGPPGSPEGLQVYCPNPAYAVTVRVGL